MTVATSRITFIRRQAGCPCCSPQLTTSLVIASVSAVSLESDDRAVVELRELAPKGAGSLTVEEFGEELRSLIGGGIVLVEDAGPAACRCFESALRRVCDEVVTAADLRYQAGTVDADADTLQLLVVVLELLSGTDSKSIQALAIWSELAGRTTGPLYRLVLEERQGKGRRSPGGRRASNPGGRPVPAESNGHDEANAARESVPAETAPDLAEGGSLSRVIEGFEHRQGQIEMAKAIETAFANEANLIVEAGTGVGKSLAYLFPASEHAEKSGSPIVVSTHTRALQEQILHQDVPILQEARRQSGRRPIKAVSLKGRSNYLCQIRWNAAKFQAVDDPATADFYAKVALWELATETGDKAELKLSGEEERLFQRLSAEEDACPVSQCQLLHARDCFLLRSRRAAQAAQIVVVNHALLLTDATAGSQILPRFDCLVLDEAHQIETVATKQMSLKVDQPGLVAAGRALAWLDRSSISGILGEAMRVYLAGGLSLIDRDGSLLAEATRSAVQVSQAIEDDAAAFFAIVERVMESAGRNGSRQESVRVTDGVRSQPIWSDLEIAWSRVDDGLAALIKKASAVEACIDRLIRAGSLDEQADQVELDLNSWVRTAKELRAALAECATAPSAERVYWLEKSPVIGRLSINAAPIHVGKMLNEALLDRTESTVLTSATLTTQGSFSFFQDRLSLQDADSLRVESPFDYKTSSLLFVANDVPEPGGAGYQEAIDDTLVALGDALDGKMLVLFTSHRALREAYEGTRDRLANKGVQVVAQDLDGPAHVVAERLKEGPGTVVLGTASLWEGVDIPGADLSALVIARLPFDVPSDPVFEARSEAYERPFMEYSLPRAVLRFRQGFGRLIRSKRDRGICVVLDRRIVAKRYGQEFIRSLPGCGVVVESHRKAAAIASDWLER